MKNDKDKETIQEILKKARAQGVEEKVKKIISKYEDSIKSAKDENERHHIAVLGLVELHKTIGCVGPLIVDGVEILPADPSYQEAINLNKRLVNLD
jgi:hypothetical protein